MIVKFLLLDDDYIKDYFLPSILWKEPISLINLVEERVAERSSPVIIKMKNVSLSRLCVFGYELINYPYDITRYSKIVSQKLELALDKLLNTLDKVCK